MSAAPAIELRYMPTDGDIAVNNLESARQQSWSRFWQEPLRPGIAECIVEQEQLTSQFLGDLSALDRLGKLVNHLERVGRGIAANRTHPGTDSVDDSSLCRRKKLACES